MISRSSGVTLGVEAASQVVFISDADVVLANSAVETTLLSSGAGATLIAANSLKVNDVIALDAQGIISSVGNPTFQLKAMLGATVLGDSGAEMLGNLSDDHWIMGLEFVVRKVGVAGELMPTGGFFTSGNDHFAMINTVNIVVDTTIDQQGDITAEWGTAAAGNTVTAQITRISRLRL